MFKHLMTLGYINCALIFSFNIFIGLVKNWFYYWENISYQKATSSHTQYNYSFFNIEQNNNYSKKAR